MTVETSAALAASTFATGFLLCAGLIVAIGAQNAFVLRQGLARQHVGLVVAFCAVSDAVLIVLGVVLMGEVTARAAGLAPWVAGAGALFLAGYGLLALRRALQPTHGAALGAGGPPAAASRARVLAQVAAFTWLNPHVYLDTLWLVGTVGAQQPAPLRGAFVAGGVAASLVWFMALGYGARLLAPWFARPVAWRWLDAGIGVVMLALAAGLVATAVRPPALTPYCATPPQCR